MWKQETPPPAPVLPEHVFSNGGYSDGMQVRVKFSEHGKRVSASGSISKLTMLWDQNIPAVNDAAKLAALVEFRGFVTSQLLVLDAAIAELAPVEASVS
jgi:hypothetical protein